MIVLSKYIFSLGLVLAFLLIQGCSTAASAEDTRTLLDRLEIDDGEIGCIDLRANIDMNPWPFLTSSASLIYKKAKGENPPEC